MNTKMHIVLEGLPERVQETADQLDRAFPGLMRWRSFAELGRDHAVRLEGDAAEQGGGVPRLPQLANRTAVANKSWKLSSSGGVLPQHRVFCASRFRAMSA